MNLQDMKAFTIIELLIVLMIISIIAVIAYPAYTDHSVKTKRNIAMACLSDYSQWMERYYTSNGLTYESAVLPAGDCQRQLNGSYSFSFDGTPTSNTFTIKAVATGGQATADDAACVELVINHKNQKTPTSCW